MCTPGFLGDARKLRNGLDFVPKKTYPPDYSNVPDVRSWQMSPFSQERFDLNEIQIAEKKGLKGRAKLEELLKKYNFGKKEETCEPRREPQCSKCAQREKAKFQKASCGANYIYQPYGPSIMSTVSYRDVGVNRNKVYCVSAPMFSDFKIDRKNPQFLEFPFSCEGFGGTDPKKKGSKNYVPYGPTSKRFTLFQYEPMGPTMKPVKH